MLKKRKCEIDKNLKYLSKKSNLNYFDLISKTVNQYSGKFTDPSLSCGNHYNQFENRMISQIIYNKMNELK